MTSFYCHIIAMRNGNSLETRAASYCFTCSSQLLAGGFLDDDVDFNKELDAVTSTEEIDDKKKVFKCTMCGKECVSSRGLKRHTTLKHVQEEVTPKEQKKVLIAIDEFMNIVKKCADLCNEDLCLPEDTRKMFSYFDFTPDDAVELWVEKLKPVVEKFHGNAENFKFLWFIARKFTTNQKSLVVILP